MTTTKQIGSGEVWEATIRLIALRDGSATITGIGATQRAARRDAVRKLWKRYAKSTFVELKN